jgi:HEAT repeat protein
MWILSRGQVNNALRYRGRSAGDWLSASRASDPTTRAEAAYALTQVRLATPDERRAALAAEGQLLGDPEEDVRSEATDGLIDLARQDDDGATATSVAAAVLRSSLGLDTRVAALHVLAGVGQSARTAEPAIADLVRDPSPSVRAAAITALGRIGASDPAILAIVARAVGDSDTIVREAALAALTELGADASIVVAAAIPALADSMATVRELAAYALGALRPVPQAAIASLADRLGDSERDVRLAAAGALGHALPTQSARSALERASRDPDTAVSAPARSVLNLSPR